MPELTFEQKEIHWSLLEKVCQKLELSKTQYKSAVEHYNAVGEWLADSEDPVFEDAVIYPQGSVRLETTVKPLGQEEYDIDLVCFLPKLNEQADPDVAFNKVGDRLKAHGNYKQMLSPLKRGWRLDYANEFHMDITPSIYNPTCIHNGEYVPDRKLDDWKPSNPKGYADWFNDIAALSPMIGQENYRILKEARAEVEQPPEQGFYKGFLKRVVQILKRHRDITCSGKDDAPISIVITTLAAKAYLAILKKGQMYSHEVDLLTAIIQEMPHHISENEQGYLVENPRTEGENFAEKWNDPGSKKASAFQEWIDIAEKNINDFIQERSLEKAASIISESFGPSISETVINEISEGSWSSTEDLVKPVVPHVVINSPKKPWKSN